MVSDPVQARFLTDPVKKAYFVPFLARERRIQEAATELSCSINRMLYQVRTLLACGLLQIVREEQRAGRPVKVYRSVHDAYFVPFEATPYDTLEQRITVQGVPIWGGLVASYADALRRSQRHGHLLTRTGDRVTTTDQLPDTTPNGQALFWSDTIVELTDVDARELADQIRRWYRDAQQRRPRGTDPTARPYLCLAALLPSKEASAHS